jgi:hypothetical protein
MNFLSKKRFSNGVSAMVLATGMSFAAGVGTLVLVAAPAMAQTTLSSDQVAAIHSQLQAALAAATTADGKQAAISQAVQTAVGLYGAGATSAITAAVIQTAEGAGVDNFSIGRGLALASAGLISSNNMVAANTIASTVSNEANQGEITGYTQTVTSLGYSNLASIAGSSPTVSGGTTGGTGGQGGIGLGGTGGGATGGGAGGGGGGGCLNPSCTSL